MRDLRNEQRLDLDQLLADTDTRAIDPSDCPTCDGTLVPNGPITPGTDNTGRLRRHCSRCEISVEQRWELDRVVVAGTDAERTGDTRLETCPDCETALDAVGNFFDHHDGSGRQQRACPACAVDIDEWWHYRESTTDEQ